MPHEGEDRIRYRFSPFGIPTQCERLGSCLAGEPTAIGGGVSLLIPGKSNSRGGFAANHARRLCILLRSFPGEVADVESLIEEA